MKKLFTILLVVLLAFPVFASGEVVVLSSPDMEIPEYDGSIDHIVIGKGIDLGDRIYLPVSGEFTDIVYTDDPAFQKGIKSGADAENLLLVLDVLNMAPSSQSFFGECAVTVTYTNERGEYVFGGNVRQGRQVGLYKKEQKDFESVDPLYHSYYAFYCTLPNFVKETKGRIVMNIQVGDTVMTYVFRE